METQPSVKQGTVVGRTVVVETRDYPDPRLNIVRAVGKGKVYMSVIQASTLEVPSPHPMLMWRGEDNKFYVFF